MHLLSPGRLQYDTIVPELGLVQVLERLSRLTPVPDVLVFTGDLADKAEPAAYARLRELVEPAAAAMGAQIVWVMGNHDERAPYAKGLFDRDLGDTPAEAVPAQDAVYDVSGPAGHLARHQHAPVPPRRAQRRAAGWLAEELATPAEHGTILALHHPPIPVPMIPQAAVIELLEMDRLAAVIEGTDVRIILGGHYHYSTYSTFAGIPVSVASASCYTTDVAPQDRLISGVDGHQAFTMMHLYDDQIVSTVVPLAEAPEVSGYGIDMLPLIDAMSPEERTETISRKNSDFNIDSEGPLTED